MAHDERFEATECSFLFAREQPNAFLSANHEGLLFLDARFSADFAVAPASQIHERSESRRRSIVQDHVHGVCELPFFHALPDISVTLQYLQHRLRQFGRGR